MILHNFVLLKTNWFAVPVFLAGLSPALPGTEGFLHSTKHHSAGEAPHTAGSCKLLFAEVVLQMHEPTEVKQAEKPFLSLYNWHNHSLVQKEVRFN